jgi:hypothetical protein
MGAIPDWNSALVLPTFQERMQRRPIPAIRRGGGEGARLRVPGIFKDKSSKDESSKDESSKDKIAQRIGNG